eukprot:2491492-Rhodomonas_salina.1
MRSPGPTLIWSLSASGPPGRAVHQLTDQLWQLETSHALPHTRPRVHVPVFNRVLPKAPEVRGVIAVIRLAGAQLKRNSSFQRQNSKLECDGNF